MKKPSAKQVFNFYECSQYLEKKHNKDFSDYYEALIGREGWNAHKLKYEQETGDIEPVIVKLPGAF